MKKLIITLLLIGFTSIVPAQEFDIPAKSRRSVDKSRIVSISDDRDNKVLVIEIANGYKDDGKFIETGREVVVFGNNQDVSEYKSVSNAVINRAVLRNAVKAKMGL